MSRPAGPEDGHVTLPVAQASRGPVAVTEATSESPQLPNCSVSRQPGDPAGRATGAAPATGDPAPTASAAPIARLSMPRGPTRIISTPSSSRPSRTVFQNDAYGVSLAAGNGHARTGRPYALCPRYQPHARHSQAGNWQQRLRPLACVVVEHLDVVAVEARVVSDGRLYPEPAVSVARHRPDPSRLERHLDVDPSASCPVQQRDANSAKRAVSVLHRQVSSDPGAMRAGRYHAGVSESSSDRRDQWRERNGPPHAGPSRERVGLRKNLFTSLARGPTAQMFRGAGDEVPCGSTGIGTRRHRWPSKCAP